MFSTRLRARQRAIPVKLLSAATPQPRKLAASMHWNQWHALVRPPKKMQPKIDGISRYFELFVRVVLNLI